MFRYYRAKKTWYGFGNYLIYPISCIPLGDTIYQSDKIFVKKCHGEFYLGIEDSLKNKDEIAKTFKKILDDFEKVYL